MIMGLLLNLFYHYPVVFGVLIVLKWCQYPIILLYLKGQRYVPPSLVLLYQCNLWQWACPTLVSLARINHKTLCHWKYQISKWILKFSGRIILYLQEIPAKPPLQTRDSLQRLCSTMKHRILSRAFYGCKYPKYIMESAVDASLALPW